MKEELVRVLNSKLNDINADIDSLVELNNKIESENNNLSYVSNILELFNDNGENNILNFVKLSKEDFEKVLSIIGDESKEVFNTNGCNYDGLTYLINGINSGISLVLTDEQKNGINYLIDKLNGKVDDYTAAIDGYELVKTRYATSDVDELKGKRDNYNHVISNLDNEKYVADTDLLMEAIKYADLSDADTVDLLTYVLKYNADVYEKNGSYEEEVKDDYNINYQDENSEPVEYNNENVEDYEETSEEDESNEDVFHFNTISESNISEEEPITFENENASDYEETNKEESEAPLENNDEVDYIPATEYTEETPVEEYTPSEETTEPEEYDNDYQTSNDNVDDVNIENEEVETPAEEVASEEKQVEIDESKEEPIENEANISDGFEDVIDEHEDYEEQTNNEGTEKTSTRDLQSVLEKYGIKADNSYLNELVAGDINNYQNILETLKDKGLIDKLSRNMNLFAEVLLYSNSDAINKVLQIIEEDLSVDKEDFEITTKITIDTIPTIFVVDGGNFDNFIENTKVFKEIGLNLINLFDFSKEIFVAENNRIVNNLDIVKKYGYEINYKNAKYLLLLPNVADKLDYYVESVYEDKLKNETFDGIEYVKDYAAKLNVVTDETIKRIRYASENGKKVFGSKPGSLSGEITNLKVNALDISSDYLNKFFDNDFANLTGDEVREYERLVHNSSNVGNYADELEMLQPYLQGLRYVIDGINISYNKVVRNYNILRSYGIDNKKALEFAVCYNLVITKEEYDKLKGKLEELGGNR